MRDLREVIEQVGVWGCYEEELATFVEDNCSGAICNNIASMRQTANDYEYEGCGCCGWEEFTFSFYDENGNRLVSVTMKATLYEGEVTDLEFNKA